MSHNSMNSNCRGVGSEQKCLLELPSTALGGRLTVQWSCVEVACARLGLGLAGFGSARLD